MPFPLVICLAGALWIACSAATAGLYYAYLQEGGPWPEYAAETMVSDGIAALVMSVGGPIMLGVILLLAAGIPYGWRMPFTGCSSFDERLKRQIKLRGYR